MSDTLPISADRVARLEELGRGAGFTACGVASCEPSGHGEYLDAWLARGAHGTMEWMARTAAIRKDLRSKWTWARSAFVGAVNYLGEPKRRAEAEGLARYVARYARPEVDYHDTLKARLRAWGDRIENELGHCVQRVALVDMSAVLERELAARAGVGWIGKNTCLIGDGGDSWRFLGVLLTDLVVAERREPLTERCGTCRACMDACPTDAIPEPWFVDASRCISYLTIEHREEFAEELRESTGDWLFGCDICQEVCPWNHKVEPTADPTFATGAAISGVELHELLAMDENQFRAHFRGTPLTRPKRRGMIRNALIVARNVGDARALDVAKRLVEDEDELIRETARWAVGSQA